VDLRSRDTPLFVLLEATASAGKVRALEKELCQPASQNSMDQTT
jgi:hypothetical protein